ncbi:cupin domain-containing protein [Megalodesulfovibrio paquesii]
MPTMLNHHGECLDCGVVETAEARTQSASIPWNPHPAFAGVWMKHLICGADTTGRLSCHLIRVEPGCCLESHVHDAQLEVHEVVSGSATAEAGGKTMAYAPGVMAVIPQQMPHLVRAGEDGLWMRATFAPALR